MVNRGFLAFAFALVFPSSDFGSVLTAGPPDPDAGSPAGSASAAGFFIGGSSFTCACAFASGFARFVPVLFPTSPSTTLSSLGPFFWFFFVFLIPFSAFCSVDCCRDSRFLQYAGGANLRQLLHASVVVPDSGEGLLVKELVALPHLAQRDHELYGLAKR